MVLNIIHVIEEQALDSIHGSSSEVIPTKVQFMIR